MELGIIVLANVVLVPFGNTYEWALWSGVAILGVGMSSIWASIFGYLEEFFPVTSRMAASFTVAATFGELVSC